MINYDIVGLIIFVASMTVTLIPNLTDFQRLAIFSISILLLITIFLSKLYSKPNQNAKEIQKLKEKLNIHEKISNIKSRLDALEKEVNKK